MHHVLFLLICGIWGSNFLLMKKASAVFGPLTIGWGRAAGGAVVLYLFWRVLLKRRGPDWCLTWRDGPRLWIPVVLGMVYPFALQPYLIARYHHSGFFGMMVCLVPLLTIVVSIPMLGVWPKTRQVVGVVGGLGCVALLFGAGAQHGVPWQGVLWAMTVPLSYTVSNIYIKRRLTHVPPIALTCSTLTLAAMCYLPLILARPGEWAQVSQARGPGLGWALLALGVLGVVGTGLATSMFNFLIQRRGPLFAGMVTYLVPGIAVTWGWVDGEDVTVTQLAALAGILVMVVLVQWPSVDQKRLRSGL